MNMIISTSLIYWAIIYNILGISNSIISNCVIVKPAFNIHFWINPLIIINLLTVPRDFDKQYNNNRIRNVTWCSLLLFLSVLMLAASSYFQIEAINDFNQRYYWLWLHYNLMSVILLLIGFSIRFEEKRVSTDDPVKLFSIYLSHITADNVFDHIYFLRVKKTEKGKEP